MLDGLVLRSVIGRPLEVPEFDGNVRILSDGIEGVKVARMDYDTATGKLQLVYANGSVSPPFDAPTGLRAPTTPGRYVLENGAWTEARELPVFPADDKIYGFKNGEAVVVPTGNGGSGGIADAPSDAHLYGRQGGTWKRVPTYGGGAAGPVGRVRVHAYHAGVTAAGAQFHRFTVPDGYVLPGLFDGAKLSFSDMSGRGGTYGQIVYVYANPRGYGQADTEGDIYLGRFLIGKDNSYTMEREGIPGDSDGSVSPYPIPSGAVIVLQVDASMGAAEWLSVDMAFDPQASA